MSGAPMKMVKRRKKCLICGQMSAHADVVNLNAIFESDPHRTVGETLLAFANVEFGEQIPGEHDYVCKHNCYRRLAECIEFQDTVRIAVNWLLTRVDERSSVDASDSRDEGLEIEQQATSMSIDDVVDWDCKDIKLCQEKTNLFDVEIISSAPDQPTDEGEEHGEVGSLFVQPEAKFVTTRMQFQNFAYLELNGHRCCGCPFIARTIHELSQHAGKAHLTCHDNGSVPSDRPYVCSVCSSAFETEPMLDSHKLKQAKQVFICNCCRLAFSTKQHLMKHIVQYTAESDTNLEMLTDIKYPDDDDEDRENDDSALEEPHDGDKLNGEEAAKDTILEDELVTLVEEYDDYRIMHTEAVRCCSCGKFFADYDEMLGHAIATHERSEVGSGDCTCPACGETFKSSKNLKHHQAINGSFKKIYYCIICNLAFVRVHLLARHLLTSFQHQANGSGNLLEKRHEEKLGAILRQKYGSYSKFSGTGCCFVRCDATFDDEAQLHNHVEEVHSIRRRINSSERTSDKHVCDVCQLGFTKAQNLQRHRYSWQMRKVNICSYCGKGFPNPSVLWEHEQVEHTNTDPQFKCEQCGKRFKKKSLIKLHLVTHQQDRKFGCDQCEARFHFRHRLKKHQRAVHATEFLYECKYCERKMPNKERYDQHMRRHTGERPFECRHNCGRTFSHTTDRRRHEMAAHTGEKPHKCQTCGTAYVRRRELQQHLQKNLDHEPVAAGLHVEQRQS